MALESIGGKYEGVWLNKLKNGDISYYINYRNENGKPVKVQVGKKTKVSEFRGYVIDCSEFCILFSVDRSKMLIVN